MIECARPDCHKLARSTCSGCGREQYCGSECQKLDWKKHKSMCPILKKLSNNLQSYDEVIRTMKEILESKKGEDLRILEHLLSYAENQFGKKVAEIGYREINWDIDVCILHQINRKKVEIYLMDDSMGGLTREEKMFPCYEKSISLLSPWLVYFDSNASDQSDHLRNTGTDCLLEELYYVHHNMANITMNQSRLDVSEGHCQRCLTYSRRIKVEGEKKTTSVFNALRLYSGLRLRKGDLLGAVSFAEDGYNLLVDVYDPVHPQVQEAASWLINCLIHQGDLLNAGRFAEQTYANLRDIKNGINQEGEEVAEGAYNLAGVILQQNDGDLIKAEKLARESLGIRTQLYGPDHDSVGMSCVLLARILHDQGKHGDETKELLERSLANFIRNEGPDGVNTSLLNIELGRFHHRHAMMQAKTSTRQRQLLQSKSYLEEGMRIEMKLHNPTHPNRVLAASLLSDVVNDLSRV